MLYGSHQEPLRSQLIAESGADEATGSKAMREENDRHFRIVSYVGLPDNGDLEHACEGNQMNNRNTKWNLTSRWHSWSRVRLVRIINNLVPCVKAPSCVRLLFWDFQLQIVICDIKLQYDY